MNHPMQIHRRSEGFEHEVLNHRLVQPRCPQPHVDFGSIQILGLRGFQSAYVRKIQGILRCCLHRLPQFLPHIARQIFVGSHINVLIRNRENNAVQFLGQLFRLNARQLRHVGQTRAFSAMETASASAAVSTCIMVVCWRIVRLVNISALRANPTCSLRTSSEQSR